MIVKLVLIICFWFKSFSSSKLLWSFCNEGGGGGGGDWSGKNVQLKSLLGILRRLQTPVHCDKQDLEHEPSLLNCGLHSFAHVDKPFCWRSFLWRNSIDEETEEISKTGDTNSYLFSYAPHILCLDWWKTVLKFNGKLLLFPQSLVSASLVHFHERLFVWSYLVASTFAFVQCKVVKSTVL